MFTFVSFFSQINTCHSYSYVKDSIVRVYKGSVNAPPHPPTSDRGSNGQPEAGLVVLLRVIDLRRENEVEAEVQPFNEEGTDHAVRAYSALQLALPASFFGEIR